MLTFLATLGPKQWSSASVSRLDCFDYYDGDDGEDYHDAHDACEDAATLASLSLVEDLKEFLGLNSLRFFCFLRVDLEVLDVGHCDSAVGCVRQQERGQLDTLGYHVPACLRQIFLFAFIRAAPTVGGRRA